MKRIAGHVAYYFLSAALFFFCLFRISKLAPPDFIPLIVGKWEVVALWLAAAWFFLALGPFLVSTLPLLKGVSKKEWTVLACLFILGLFLRSVVAPKTHRLYFDEDIYLNIAQSIHSENRAMTCDNGYTEFGRFHCVEPVLNKEPDGWPFLLSLCLNFFNSPERAGEWFSIFLSALLIPLVYFIGRELFEGTAPLWAAGTYALLPLPIQWAPTVEPGTPFTLLAALSIFLALRMVKNKEMFPYLFFPVLAFAIQIRPEAILLLIPLLSILLAARDFSWFEDKRATISWGIFLVLLIPYALHLYHSRHENWGSNHGSMFAFHYVASNFVHNVALFFEPERFPTLDAFLIVFGFFEIRKNRLAKWLLSSWLLVFFGIYLFFYAGSYDYGVDVRYCLPILLPVALLAGAGVTRVSEWLSRFRIQSETSIAGLMLFFLLLELPAIRIVGQEGWQARTDHDFITRIVPTLPNNAAIFCATPSEVMVAGGHAIGIGRIQDQALQKNLQKEGEIPYFYFDAWCSTPGFKDECQNILNTYNLRLVAWKKIRDKRLSLYKIIGNNKEP